MSASSPNALHRVEEIAARLGDAAPAFFFDYDGTLTPIVQRPELAVLSDAMRTTLQRIAARFPVAVVSGRDRGDVEALVGLPNLVYAGSHGFDISGPDGLRLEHEQGRQCAGDLDAAAATLSRRLAGVPGVLVERKKFAAAVHFRMVARGDVPMVRDAVAAVAAAHARLRQTGGKQVLELRPDLNWDKGRAVLWLLEALGLDGPDVTPVYLGDDLTDEDAFRVVADRGIGIFVGEPPAETAARYALRDPGETRDFLERLITTAPTGC